MPPGPSAATVIWGLILAMRGLVLAGALFWGSVRRDDATTNRLDAELANLRIDGAGERMVDHAFVGGNDRVTEPCAVEVCGSCKCTSGGNRQDSNRYNECL